MAGGWLPGPLSRLDLKMDVDDGTMPRIEMPWPGPLRHSDAGMDDISDELNDLMRSMSLQDDFPVPRQKQYVGKQPLFLLAMAGPGIVAPPPKSAFPQFTEGPPQRPNIHHDHGFLDDGNGNIDPGKYEQATWDDRRSKIWWWTKLEGAELLRPDLKDATDAYRHFLDNTGTDLTVNYEGFLQSDDSGKKVLSSALEDTRVAAVTIHDAKVPTPPLARTDQFSIRSDIIAVGADSRYPYPATENWQKAIGAHFIYIDAA